jgi:hypothetical protein
MNKAEIPVRQRIVLSMLHNDHRVLMFDLRSEHELDLYDQSIASVGLDEPRPIRSNTDRTVALGATSDRITT